MSRTPKNSGTADESEPWAETHGDRPHTVWVGERPEKKNVVYLRWQVANKPKWESLGFTIRDERGRRRAKRMDEARQRAKERHTELATGRTVTKAQLPLTLQQGFDLAFSERGMYPVVNRHVQDTKKYTEIVMALLGPNTLWENVTPGMIRGMWRTLARNAKEGTGARSAELVVQTLFVVSRWLQGERQTERFPSTIPRWREELKKEWERITGREVVRKQLRFTREEMQALWAALPQADVRLVPLLVLGAELRGGQVIRTMRSQCDLSPGAGVGNGVVLVKGSGRKGGAVLFLNPEERAVLDAMMRDGHLSLLEAAHQSGELPDYPLFPAGRLRAGKVPPDRDLRPMNRRTLRDLFTALEEAAGVEHVEGRALYGLRRLSADLAEDSGETDARVLDRVGGWTPGSKMRQAIYQNQQDAGVLTRAAQVRKNIRPTFLWTVPKSNV